MTHSIQVVEVKSKHDDYCNGCGAHEFEKGTRFFDLRVTAGSNTMITRLCERCMVALQSEVSKFELK